MSRLFFYEGLLLNLRQKIHKSEAAYITKEAAYKLLKESTGQDLGYDIGAWQKWLKENNKR